MARFQRLRGRIRSGYRRVRSSRAGRIAAGIPAPVRSLLALAPGIAAAWWLIEKVKTMRR